MINKELIVLDREFSDKAGVFQSVADKAASLNLISDKTKFMQALFARETEFPTSIGYDVGIPHCRSSAVTNPSYPSFEAHNPSSGIKNQKSV